MDTENLLKLLKEHKVGYDVADITVDDLIKMKKAAGRPKDNEDLKFLRRLKQKK